MAGRQVTITVTDTVVGKYEARSYPHDGRDAQGYVNLYEVPVYKIVVSGTDDQGKASSRDFMAPRFMPYYNTPTNPSPHYKARGWINAGLSSARKVVVTRYKQDYRVQNRFSPGIGAIVVYQSFFIHAGPASLTDVGFGSAGCIEIVGNFDDFKGYVAGLSGIHGSSSDAAIQGLVSAGKLIVIIRQTRVPDIKKKLTRRYKL